LTLEDVMPGHGSQESRLLGYYSRQGLELALERHGFLDRLRGKGFKAPTLVCDFDDPSRQTITIFSDAVRSERLVELVLHRERRVVPASSCCRSTGCSCRTRARASATAARACPASNYPGSACSRSWSLCWWSPASASVWPACWSRRRSSTSRCSGSGDSALSHPRDGARLRALREALGGMSLSAMTDALQARRVIDRRTGEPVEYQPAPMVLPLSPELQAALDSEGYTQAMDAAADELQFERRP
jgi:hypothetical protein